MRSEQAANQYLKTGKYTDAYLVNCRVAQRKAEQRAASDRKKLLMFKVVAAIGAVCIGAKLFYVVTA